MNSVFIKRDFDTPRGYTDMNHWAEIYPVIEDDGTCWFIDTINRRWVGEPGPLRVMGPLGTIRHEGFWCSLEDE